MATTYDKLQKIKSLLGITSSSEDSMLTSLLEFSEASIISWKYSLSENAPINIPEDLEPIQIEAVITTYNKLESLGEKSRNENGVNRQFAYSDISEYVRKKVTANVRIL